MWVLSSPSGYFQHPNAKPLLTPVQSWVPLFCLTRELALRETPDEKKAEVAHQLWMQSEFVRHHLNRNKQRGSIELITILAGCGGRLEGSGAHQQQMLFQASRHERNILESKNGSILVLV